jgi:hypothetical protein
VSPVVFSATRMSSRASQQSWMWQRIAVFAVVEHRPQAQGAFHVPPASFDREELFVRRSEVFGGEGDVGGAQQPLAVQVRFACGGAVVDAQQPGLGPAQEPAQTWFALQGPDELVASAGGPGV